MRKTQKFNHLVARRMNKIHKNVILGKNCIIEEFCIIGVPPKGKKDGELKTVIGENAHVRSHTVIYAGNTIGKDFQTGHGTFVREENTIGDKFHRQRRQIHFFGFLHSPCQAQQTPYFNFLWKMARK